jgi:hypothetical protein
MMVRTRLMLQCPHCGESKLINVTILDDIVGPVMCESCVAQTILERRLAKLAESATPPSEPTPEAPRLEVVRPAGQSLNPGRAA